MTDHRQGELIGFGSSITPLKYILLFCTATFFFWATQYLYAPILPVYSQSIGANLSMVGAIVATYAIPQFLLRIPIGVLFDATTRKKPLLVAGIVMATIGALGLGLAPDPWMLFWARTVSGIGSATWVCFMIFFTAYYTQQNATRAISVLTFVLLAALVVATYCGGLVAEVYGYSYTFFGAAVLGIVALIALLFIREPVITKVERISWNNFLQVATYPPLLIVSFMGLLTQFADWAGLFGFVPVYGARIGASSADLGIITMLSLASSAVAALAVVRVAKLWGTPFAILLGSILLGGTILVIPSIHDVSLLKAVMFVNGLGRGLLMTLLTSLSIQAISPQQQATAMGIFQSTYALGMLAGPLVSGFLASSFGLAAIFYLSAFCCLATAGIAYLPAVKHLGLQ